MTKQKTVLVTGGAGYIGSHVAHTLMARGYQVVVLDDLSTGRRELLPQGAILAEGDIADKALVAQLVRIYGIKDMIHLAAFVDVGEAEREPEKYYSNNHRKTKLLLGAARDAGVERCILSSTAAVYGNLDQVPVPETALLRPVGVYGKSKLFAEREVALSGLQYGILRYFNVAGANHLDGLGYRTDQEPSHLIRRVVLAMLGDIDHIDIFGTDYPTPDGTAIRDYIHVRDLAQVHVDILAHLRHGGTSDIFNVGYGRGRSVLEVIGAAEKVLGKSIPRLNGRRRKGDVMISVADSRKLRETIDWLPQFQSLGGMLYDELEWVKSQRALAR